MGANTKRIAKNFSWLSFGDVVGRGLNFVVIIYLARVLGVANFGLFNFAFAFLVYFELINDSGLTLLGTRDIANQKAKPEVVSLNVFVLRLIISCFIFLLAVFFVSFLTISVELRLLFIGTFLCVFFKALSADWVFAGFEKMEYIAFSKILFGLLFFGLTLLFVKLPSDLILVPFIYFSSGLLVAIVFLLILYKFFVRFSLSFITPKNWLSYLLTAMPVGASLILVQVYHNMDTIMLGFMSQPEMVGYYNASCRLFLAIAGFLLLWQAAVFPVISRKVKEGQMMAEDFLNKYVRVTLLITFPTVFLVTLLSSFMVNLFFGSEYFPSVLALQILIWSLIFVALTGLYGSLILIPFGKNRQFLYGVGLGAIVNVLLNFLLIPVYGFIGASVATLLSEIVVVMVLFYLSKDLVRIRVFKNGAFSFFVACLAFVPAFFLLKSLPNNLGVLISSFLFCFIYLIVVFSSKERIFLIDFYKKFEFGQIKS